MPLKSCLGVFTVTVGQTLGSEQIWCSGYMFGPYVHIFADGTTHVLQS